MAIDGLRAKGWDVHADLKVPWAQSPEGATRLWFKSQAVYMNDLGTEPRDFANTHSLSSDMREYKSVDDLLASVKRMRDIEGRDGSREAPMRALGCVVDWSRGDRDRTLGTGTETGYAYDVRPWDDGQYVVIVSDQRGRQLGTDSGRFATRAEAMAWAEKYEQQRAPGGRRRAGEAGINDNPPVVGARYTSADGAGIVVVVDRIDGEWVYYHHEKSGEQYDREVHIFNIRYKKIGPGAEAGEAEERGLVWLQRPDGVYWANATGGTYWLQPTPSGDYRVTWMATSGDQADLGTHPLQAAYQVAQKYDPAHPERAAAEASRADLRVGDRVVVVRGRYSGTHGRVTHVQGDTVSVDLDHPVHRVLGPLPMDRHDVMKSDAPRAVLENSRAGGRRIKTTYSRVKPTGDSSDYPYEEDHGWLDEEGASMEPDDYDRQEGTDAVDKAVTFLRDEGAVQASSSQFHPGVWYSTESEQDPRTGEWEEKSFHLYGFTEDEQRQVYLAFTRGRARRVSAPPRRRARAR